MKMTETSRATVFRVKNRIKNGKGIQRRPGSGRPQKLDANDKRRISILTRKHNRWSREDIARAAHKKGSSKVSRWTIGRYLKISGWLKIVPKPKPMLTSKHKAYRVKWAQENLNIQWDDVWISDESCFQFLATNAPFGPKIRPPKLRSLNTLLNLWCGELLVFEGRLIFPLLKGEWTRRFTKTLSMKTFQLWRLFILMDLDSNRITPGRTPRERPKPG